MNQFGIDEKIAINKDFLYYYTHTKASDIGGHDE